MSLSDITTIEELIAAINEYCTTPRRPPLKGSEIGLILNKIIELLPENIDVNWGDITGSLSDQSDLSTAINGKVNISDIVNTLTQTTSGKVLDARQGKVLNDLITALASTVELLGNKNQAYGYAGLDSTGKVAAAQLPSYVDDVLEYANYAALPATGESGKIYITLDTNKEYRWSGSAYIQIVASPGSTDEVAEGSTNKYFTASRVLSSLLTGIGFSTSTAVVATDTILQAFGKLQAQITALFKIPAGGTTGQILAKNSNTDGDTHWIDAPSGGGVTSYAPRSFNEILTFDSNFKMFTNQTVNIAFVLGASPVDDVIARVTIIGDGLHNCTFPSDWRNVGGQLFDNRDRNYIYLEYAEGVVLYAISRIPTPDVTAPLLLSAVIENSAKNKVVLTYSEVLNEGIVPATSAFTANLSKAVSSVVISGAVVTVTMSTDYANGDIATISYNSSTGNPIQDAAGNHAVSLSSQAITNNVNPAKQSASITTSAQLQQTTVVPTNALWGDASGDYPYSVSFWIKRANGGTSYIYEILSTSNPSNPDNGLIINGSGTMQWYFYRPGGGTASINLNSNIAGNIWTHVVLTYPGNGLASGLKVYFNGILQAVTIADSSYTVMNSNVPGDTRLAIFGRVGTYGQTLPNTSLCSFYMWRRELSQSDVTELYNSGQTINPTTVSFASSLRARYEFDGNANDTGTNAYNLTGTTAPAYSFDAP